MVQKVPTESLKCGHFIREGYGKDKKLLITDHLVTSGRDRKKLYSRGVRFCNLSEDKNGINGKGTQEFSGNPVGAEIEELIRMEVKNPDQLIKQTERPYEELITKTEGIFSAVHGSDNHSKTPRELESLIQNLMEHLEEFLTSVRIRLRIENHDDTTIDRRTLLYAENTGLRTQATVTPGSRTLLRDVDKTQASPDIIQKNGKLNDEEWKTVN